MGLLEDIKDFREFRKFQETRQQEVTPDTAPAQTKEGLPQEPIVPVEEPKTGPMPIQTDMASANLESMAKADTTNVLTEDTLLALLSNQEALPTDKFESMVKSGELERLVSAVSR